WTNLQQLRTRLEIQQHNSPLVTTGLLSSELSFVIRALGQ
ncbi:hypothetical protein A2U01_0098933, partial [Trifolium medium]|nr:hypothetical protein [Trifolium medium]